MKTLSLAQLQYRITLFLSATIIFLFLIAGFLSVRIGYQALVTQKQQDALSMGTNIAIQVQSTFSKAKKTMESLSHMLSHQDMGKHIDDEKISVVADASELIDAIGITSNTLYPEFHHTSRGFQRIRPDEAHLQIIQELLTKIQNGWPSALSNVYLSKSNEPCVAIAAPIFQGQTLSGILVGGILLREHSLGGIDQVKIGESGYVYLVDSEGNIIYHPEKEKILEDFSDKPAVKALLSTQQPGVLEYTGFDNKQIVGAYAPVHELGWGVVVRQPRQESYAFAVTIRNMLLLLIGVSVIISLALGVYLTRKFFKPLIDTNSTLVQKNQLERSDRLASLGQLAAGLAHEINNPLNIISGFAELLKTKIDQYHPQQNYIDEILRESQRCKQLIQKLLSFARQSPLDVQTCNINQIVSDVAELMKPHTSKNKIDVVVRPDLSLPLIKADPNQIKQVLLNLAMNSCQAVPQQGQIILATRNIANNGHIVIEVEDNGPGVAPDDTQKLFAPFFTSKDQGTGLGLAVSHSIIERHHGQIEYESAETGGARFKITLPKEMI